MGTAIDNVIATLRTAGRDPQKNGTGYKALCPSHDDHNPSLSIFEGDDGKVVLKCHVGCKNEDIIKKLGLKWADLFPPDPNRQAGIGKPKGLFETFVAARDWMAQKIPGVVAGEWEYSPDFRIVRYDKTDGSKEFKPYRREAGGWRIKDPDGKLPLYHLDELAAAPVVWVLEGEKCVDLARGKGEKCTDLAKGLCLVATTSSHGSKSAYKTDWTPLAGKTVYIIPDNDQAGEKYANDVGALLAKLDPKPVVKVVRLPVQNEGDDIDEWLSDVVPESWTDIECRDELLRLANEAPEWTAPAPPVEFNLTDTGNGERFATKHGEDVRHVNAWSTWLTWRVGRWAIDETGAAMRLAKRIARSIWKGVS
jgi:putative DNA primase/helicase